MPQTPHVEKHFTSTEAVRDIVIGMSDGLTVPFALAAGLSGAGEATETGIIITAGLAEVAAGATLAPYFFFRSVHSALVGSVIVTLLALLVFGYIKGRFTTARPFRSAWQTVIVGGLAATAAFVIAKAIG